MKIVLLAFILMWSGFVSSAENLGLTIEEFHGQLNSELQEANNAFDFNLVKNIKIKMVRRQTLLKLS